MSHISMPISAKVRPQANRRKKTDDFNDKKILFNISQEWEKK